MRKLRPTSRCQMFSQGQRAITLSATKAHQLQWLYSPTLLYQVHILFVYCELSLDMLLCRCPLSLACTCWIGNSPGQALYAYEFRYVIFSFLCTLPQCLETMSPQLGSFDQGCLSDIYHSLHRWDVFRWASGRGQWVMWMKVEPGGKLRED